MRGGAGVDPGTTQYYLDGTETLLTVKSSIALTDEQHTFARALVEVGRYSSLSAVLQQGVDLLRQRMDAEELETAARGCSQVTCRQAGQSGTMNSYRLCGALPT